MCKILELYDKNQWRNNQSKLATFDPILQRPHSALARSLCRYHHHHCDSNRGSMERPMVPPGPLSHVFKIGAAAFTICIIICSPYHQMIMPLSPSLL